MSGPDTGGTNRLRGQKQTQEALKGVRLNPNVIKKQKIRQRKKADTASGSLLPKAKEKTEKFEILVNGEEVVDSYTGYPMKIYIPKGFDGGVDFYFPGGGTTIKQALRMDSLNKIWEKSCKNGSRRALVIIEGKWDKSKKEKKKEGWRKRYLRFGESRALPSILHTIHHYSKSSVKNINAIGHSMGGQALHFLSGRAKVGTLSYLDATYWDPQRIIKFARRGGKVNIAYRKGTKTARNARKVINDKRLGMKEIVPGHWQSSNKKLNIYALSANKVGHGMVRSLFFEPFTGKESVAIDVSALSMRRKTVISPQSHPVKTMEPGKLHKIYITDESSNGVMHMPEKERAKYIQKLQNSSILEIRKNTKLLTEKLKGKNDAQKAINRTEECKRRIAAYSDKHEGGWSRVNYSQMDIDPSKPSHENGVGLGETYGLDPNNKKLAVKNRHTGEITIVMRKVVGKGKRHEGRMAYVDNNGNYFATHTGDWVRILSSHETDLEDPKQLNTYMAELKKDTEIRNKYTEDNMEIESGDGGYVSTSYGGLGRVSPVLVHARERGPEASKRDKALMEMILEEHGKLEGVNKQGDCEANAIMLAGKIRSRMTGKKFSWKSLRQFPLFGKATARYRGKSVHSLKHTDFGDFGENLDSGRIPVGAAMYVAMARPKLAKYIKGSNRNKIAPVISKSGRHWWTYAGKNERGEVIFVDNARKNRRKTLKAMKRSVGDRNVYNIHDPYVGDRDRLYASRGLRKKESIPETKKMLIKLKDHFGRTAYLRPDVALAMQRAMKVAEKSKPKMLLRIVNGFRDYEHQDRLRKDSDARGKSVVDGNVMVAKKYVSRHHTGAAVDVECYVASEVMTDGKTKYVKDQSKLRPLLSQQGFQFPLSYEKWHAELGTIRANKLAKIKKAGYKKIGKIPGVSTDKLNKGPVNGKKFYII